MEYVFKDHPDHELLVQSITEASSRNELFFFIGAGVSMNANLPSWDEYVERMINYWLVNLHTINPDRQSADRGDIQLLELIKKDFISNKTKVDLVYTLIKRYCYDNYTFNSERFESAIMKFNELLFCKTHSTSRDNPILDELVNIKAMFITTNYDYEIEEALKRFGNSHKTIDGMNGITTMTSYEDVFHLHGVAEGEFQNFILSSNSYRDLYLKKISGYDKFENMMINKERPVVVYIGSSLMEEEILNLVNNSNPNIEQYALMKRSGSSEEDKRYSKLKQDFYKNDKNIQIIWYGDKYEDLVFYIRKLAKDYEKYRNELQNIININYDFLSKPIEKEEIDNYVQSIQELIKNEEHSLVNKILNQITSENDLIYLNNSKAFIQNIEDEKLSFSASKIFNCYFEHFDLNEQKKVIQSIKNRAHINSYDLEIISKYIEKEDVEEKYQIVEDIIGSRIEYLRLNDLLKNEIIRSFWFLNELKRKDYYSDIYSEKLNDLKYDNSQSFQTRLYKSLNEMDDYLKYSEQKLYKHSHSFMLLVDSIINRRIETSKIMHDALHYESFQKALIYIDINMDIKIWDEQLLDKIEWDRSSYGSILNDFIKKHSQEITRKGIAYKDDYRDMVTSLDGKFIDLPFIEMSEALKLQEKGELINFLLSKENHENSRYTGEQFTEENIDGQNKEFIKYLSDYSYYKSNKPVINSMIDDFLEEKFLIDNYFNVIIEFLTLNYENEIAERNLLFKFIKQYFQKGIKNHYVNFYEFLIKTVKIRNELTKEILELLDSVVDVKSFTLPEYDIHISKLRFINSELGSYFDFIFKLCNEINKDSDIAIQLMKKQVSEIENGDIKNYLNGMFSNHVEKKENDISENYFIGLSHYYRIKPSKRYVDVVISLLDSKPDDEILAYNMAMIMVNYIGEEKNVSVSVIEAKGEILIVKIIDQILYWYFSEIDERPKYESFWLQKFMSTTKNHWRIIGNIIAMNEAVDKARKRKFLEFYKSRSFRDVVFEDNFFYVYSLRNIKKSDLIFKIELICLIIEKDFDAKYNAYRSESIENILQFLYESKEDDLLNNMLKSLENSHLVLEKEKDDFHRKYFKEKD